jgi:hypothetical protein
LLGSGSAIGIFESGYNLIGGSTTAARNVIASQGTAVQIYSYSPGAEHNLIEGNYIGTNAAGTSLVPESGSGGSGIALVSAYNNTIVGNVIAGFGIGVPSPMMVLLRSQVSGPCTT